MMKKIILCLTLAWMSATTMFAVKAKPGITQLQLVDGTIVSATLHGDEHFFVLLASRRHSAEEE